MRSFLSNETKRLVAIIMLCYLAGCSTIQSAVTSKEAFAACRTIDVATTLTIIHKGGVELNPIMAPLVHHPVLFIAFNAVLVWWIWEEHGKMTATQKGVVNAAGCIGAVNNTVVLIK